MSRSAPTRSIVRLSVSLSARDHEALMTMSREFNLSTAWLIRRAVTEFIELHTNGAQADLPINASNGKLS